MLIKKQLVHLIRFIQLQKKIKIIINYRLFCNIFLNRSILFILSGLLSIQNSFFSKLTPAYEYKIKLKALDTLIFNSSIVNFLNLLSSSGVQMFSSFNSLKKKKKHFTVLRSPFVYKKSREQFMFNTILGLVNVKVVDSNLFLLEYLDFFFTKKSKFCSSSDLIVTKVIYL